MRIRVTDVLELFAAGLSAEQILKELPDLEPEDLRRAGRMVERRARCHRRHLAGIGGSSAG